MTNKKLQLLQALTFVKAQKSPCKNKKVGCIIIDPLDEVYIASGVNGNHLNTECLCNGKEQCVHAEISAIVSALKIQKDLKGFYLMCTNAPCTACASVIVSVGIKVVYVLSLNSRDAGLNYLRNNGVTVITIMAEKILLDSIKI